MHRGILIQVAAPTVVIGLFLSVACLISAWIINRVQTNFTKVLSENVTSLEAAEELEITVRRLRFHCFVYLADPDDALLSRIEIDNQNFQHWLAIARQAANLPGEYECIEEINAGYERYQEGFQHLRAEVERNGPRRGNRELAKASPIAPMIKPSEKLLSMNKTAMIQICEESARVSQFMHFGMLVLGLGGPASGLLLGYGMARALSRSINQLSVRIQDMAQQLDQDVASVHVVPEGDFHSLNEQLQHVIKRVQEAGERWQLQQREILHAQQLSAVGQLAASVAHEVRNPLMSIKMLAEAALRSRNPKPFTSDHLRIIHQETVRLEKTVQEFLDFARPPELKRDLCDLRQVVQQAASLIQARACQQRVSITIHCPEQIVARPVDQGQLCTVLVNLFLNALDAMPGGGRIEASLSELADKEVQFQIMDTGCGIAPAVLERLFKPFTSTKPTGSGLGLCISKRIIEDHGGSLRGENRSEGGACFILTLPNC